MSSGDFLPLLLQVLFCEQAFLWDEEAADSERRKFASVACRKTYCLECLGSKKAEDP